VGSPEFLREKKEQKPTKKYLYPVGRNHREGGERNIGQQEPLFMSSRKKKHVGEEGGVVENDGGKNCGEGKETP